MPDTCTKYVPLGTVIMSPELGYDIQHNERLGKYVHECLARYRNCDWGETNDKGKAMNTAALQSGGMIVSDYESPVFHRIRFVTNYERSQTVIMYPHEY